MYSQLKYSCIWFTFFILCTIIHASCFDIKSLFQKVEMAWDDAALNITVNPMEVISISISTSISTSIFNFNVNFSNATSISTTISTSISTSISSSISTSMSTAQKRLQYQHKWWSMLLPYFLRTQLLLLLLSKIWWWWWWMVNVLLETSEWWDGAIRWDNDHHQRAMIEASQHICQLTSVMIFYIET